jgi:hypothetical protein
MRVGLTQLNRCLVGKDLDPLSLEPFSAEADVATPQLGLRADCGHEFFFELSASETLIEAPLEPAERLISGGLPRMHSVEGRTPSGKRPLNASPTTSSGSPFP